MYRLKQTKRKSGLWAFSDLFYRLLYSLTVGLYGALNT